MVSKCLTESGPVKEWWSGMMEWSSDRMMEWWIETTWKRILSAMEWWSDGVKVVVLFIAPYSPKGGIGLNTTKVWTLTNKWWSDGMMESQNDGVKEWWDDGVMDWRRDRRMEWWSDGETERQSNGATEWWSEIIPPLPLGKGCYLQKDTNFKCLHWVLVSVDKSRAEQKVQVLSKLWQWLIVLHCFVPVCSSIIYALISLILSFCEWIRVIF